MSDKKMTKTRGKSFAQKYKHAEIILKSSDENPPSRVLQDYARLKSPHHNFSKNGGPDDELYEKEKEKLTALEKALYYINKVQNK